MLASLGKTCTPGKAARPAAEAAAFLPQQRRLARIFVGVVQRKERGFGVEHADVVGRAHLVDLVDQRRVAAQVAQAHTGQAELGQVRITSTCGCCAMRCIQVRLENGW
jgi:hypothetical protein